MPETISQEQLQCLVDKGEGSFGINDWENAEIVNQDNCFIHGQYVNVYLKIPVQNRQLA